eukprot:Sspe_Gene.114393::Locus_99940_Transcript_1_1_Confidence_1.000_Length_1638::g.114393::m.114393
MAMRHRAGRDTEVGGKVDLVDVLRSLGPPEERSTKSLNGYRAAGGIILLLLGLFAFGAWLDVSTSSSTTSLIPERTVGCDVFLTQGPYSTLSHLISYVAGRGCQVYLRDAHEETATLRHALEDTLRPRPPAFRSHAMIPVVDASNLSAVMFEEKYAKPLKPVVIRGLGETMMGKLWSLDHIVEKCGEKGVTPSVYTGSDTWAGMEASAGTTLRKYIAKAVQGSELRYLHDWPLVLECPEVGVEDITIPKYFATDYVQLLQGTRYTNQWPSLFIGPNGTQSGVHVDNLGSHAWMLQLSGVKRWRMVGGQGEAFLYPSKHASSYAVDLFNPDFEAHPLAKLADVWEATVHPGDLIFVPAGALHQVVNDGTTVGITMNWIDATCLPTALKAMRRQEGVDKSLSRFVEKLEALHLQGVLPSVPARDHVPWKVFKEQRISEEPERDEVPWVLVLVMLLFTLGILGAAWALHVELSVG